MRLNRILVPVDFSKAAEVASNYAVKLASLSNAKVVLLHVVSDEYKEASAEWNLDDFAIELRNQGVEVETIVREGKIIDTINDEGKQGHYDLMLVGTHGPVGLRQNLFGADILKLLKNSAIPSVVVQEECKHEARAQKILLPVGSHFAYFDLVKEVTEFAKLLQAEIHLYSIKIPEIDLSEELMQNIHISTNYFKTQGITFREIQEEPLVYSFGYAKQTIEYAATLNYDLIALMPHASSEHAYFANADKEKLITNEPCIPLFVASGIN
jgi:nucleotide-binding universal stress UspA family protein